MYKLIKKIIFFFETQPLTFSGWVIAFFTLLSLNLFFQFITYGFKNVNAEYFIGEIIQSYYFILYLAVVIFLYFLTREKIIKILNFVLWGFWSIIFWPVIDKIILRNNFHLSFYLYNGPQELWHNFITFFGPINPVGILYGTRIETVFIILFVGLYIYIKTKSILKTFLGGIGVYLIFYISVALPSILTFVVTVFSGGNVMEITNLDIVKFLNTPLQVFALKERNFAVTFFYKISLVYNLIFVFLLGWFQFLFNKKVLYVLLKNIRIPQMIFNWGLLIAGLFIGVYYFPQNFSFDFWSVVVLFNLFLSILFIWLFSIIINDLEDYQIDKISNKNRPLINKIISPKNYLNYGYIFLFLSLLLSLTISGQIFLLIVLYGLVTIIYSKYPFKLKRIPWISGIISAIASLFLFLMGYLLLAGNLADKNFPWIIIIYLFLVYALVLPIKDLKDIKGDKKMGVVTIANLLGENKARLYFGVITFLVYLFSPIIFRDNNLFIPVTITGGLSYWIINNKKNTSNILLYKLLMVVIIFIVILIFG